MHERGGVLQLDKKICPKMSSKIAKSSAEIGIQCGKLGMKMAK